MLDDRVGPPATYRQLLRDELRAALGIVSVDDYTLTELRDLIAIVGPARDRVRADRVNKREPMP